MSHRRLLLLRHARERDEHLGPRIMRGLFAQAAACRLTRESGARHPRLTALRNLQLRISFWKAKVATEGPRVAQVLDLEVVSTDSGSKSSSSNESYDSGNYLSEEVATGAAPQEPRA